MLLKYVGPNPPKLINRFWGKEYLFDPTCEVDEADAKLMLEDWPELFVKAEPGVPFREVNLIEPIEPPKPIEPIEPVEPPKPAGMKKGNKHGPRS